MTELDLAIGRMGWKQRLQTKRLEEVLATQEKHRQMLASFLKDRPTSLPENDPAWQAIKAHQLLERMYRGWRASMVKSAQATKTQCAPERPISTQSGFWRRSNTSIFD